GLHPAGVADRVQTALDQVRPYLGSHAGGVELLGVDPDGAARLRLQGSCDSCASSTVTAKLAIERAVLDAVPEVSRVDVENLTEPGEAAAQPRLIPVESLFRDCPAGLESPGSAASPDGPGAPGRAAAADGPREAGRAVAADRLGAPA
ncbi:MAG: NifU family protein, partial [Micromonosporaceae bacterium]